MAAPKYGLDKDIAQKLNSKYDEGRERDAKEWIEAVIKEKIEVDGKPFGLVRALKNGVILCK
jgi:hypothetical protein